MSLKNPKKLFPLDGSEIFPPESEVEYEEMRKEENNFIWSYIFKLIYLVLFVWLMVTIVGAYNEASACEKKTTVYAEYHHNSSILGDKPFYRGRDELITNVYSLILSIPTQYAIFEFGAGIDYQHQYGKEPTGTFRVRIPLWQN